MVLKVKDVVALYRTVAKRIILQKISRIEHKDPCIPSPYLPWLLVQCLEEESFADWKIIDFIIITSAVGRSNEHRKFFTDSLIQEMRFTEYQDACLLRASEFSRIANKFFLENPLEEACKIYYVECVNNDILRYTEQILQQTHCYWNYFLFYDGRHIYARISLGGYSNSRIKCQMCRNGRPCC
jgi:hypothetical protein